MSLILIRGFRVASQIIIVLTLVGLAVVSFMIGAHIISVAEGTPHLAIMAVAGLVGSTMWWYTNHKLKSNVEKMMDAIIKKPLTKVPKGKLTRQQFVDEISRRMVLEYDEADICSSNLGTKIQDIAGKQFHISVALQHYPERTLGQQLDSLYQQYLRQ